MKNILLIGCLFFGAMFTSALRAQDKSESKIIQKEVTMEVNDEGEGPVYKVKVVTDNDGKKEVVERTYSSLAEMESDTTLSIKGQEKGESGTFTFNFSDDSEGAAKAMMFTNEDGKTFNIKLEDEGESMKWTVEEEDGQKVIKSGSKAMVMILDEDQEDHGITFFSEDGDSTTIVKKYEIKMKVDDDGDSEHKNVFIIKSDSDEEGLDIADENGEKVMVWVNEDGDKTIKKEIKVKTKKSSISSATVSDIVSTDEKWASFNLNSLPALSLKTLNYYPNPNEGEFTLVFTGSKKPVIVRILDSKGNLQYESKKENFDGDFNEMINLKRFDKGAYLLQIFQNGKVLNKQIDLN